MTDLTPIIQGLTKAQRALLTGEFDLPFPRRSYGQIRRALIRKGIYADVGFTPLGKAVRAALKEEPPC